MSTETTSPRFLPRPDLRALRSVGPAARRLARRIPALMGAGYWAEFGVVAALLVGLTVARFDLGSWATTDYNTFLVNWFGYLQGHGWRGLGDYFANYNVPYLYLLYIGTLVTPDAMITVKTISAVSDLAMALGCVALLLQLHFRREMALVVGATVLLLPEVILNSAAWGQADSTYSALLVWAVWAAIRGRQRTTWVLFVLAFTFKLQAAFVLPAFVIIHVTKRWGWRGPVFGVGALIAAELPALLAGRSPGSLVAVYFDQANTYSTLTANAASLYALLPESHHDQIRSAGMFFAVASVAVVSYLILRAARRRTLTSEATILFVATLATIAPFTLPTMHERYFYVGNVLLFVYAIKRRRMLPWAVAAQCVAVSAYAPFLFVQDPVVSMGALAFIESAILFVMLRELVRTTGAMTDSLVERPVPVSG